MAPLFFWLYATNSGVLLSSNRSLPAIHENSFFSSNLINQSLWETLRKIGSGKFYCFPLPYFWELLQYPGPRIIAVTSKILPRSPSCRSPLKRGAALLVITAPTLSLSVFLQHFLTTTRTTPVDVAIPTLCQVVVWGLILAVKTSSIVWMRLPT